MPFDELRIAYAANIVVVPSDYEPFGLVSLEAQRMGTPVVVAHTGGLAETLARTGGGLSFERGSPRQLHQAMRKLLTDSALRQKLGGKKGQEQVGQLYSWRAIATEINKIYESSLFKGSTRKHCPSGLVTTRKIRAATKFGGKRKRNLCQTNVTAGERVDHLLGYRPLR